VLVDSDFGIIKVFESRLDSAESMEQVSIALSLGGMVEELRKDVHYPVLSVVCSRLYCIGVGGLHIRGCVLGWDVWLAFVFVFCVMMCVTVGYSADSIDD